MHNSYPDVICIDDEGQPAMEDEPAPRMRRKLLSFHEDVRPAFFSTFTRASIKIRPRVPLARDEDTLDYEYNSEGEWEEDDDGGEDLALDSEGEDDALEPGLEGEDDGWCVPHGYLSSDELDEDAEEGAARKGVVEQASVKGRPKVNVIGVIFAGQGGNGSAKLEEYKCRLFGDGPCDPFAVPVSIALPVVEAMIEVGKKNGSGTPPAVKRVVFPVEVLPGLLQIVSESSMLPLQKIVDKVKEAYSALQKTLIERQIRESCVREKRLGKSGWYLKSGVAEAKGDGNVNVVGGGEKKDDKMVIDEVMVVENVIENTDAGKKEDQMVIDEGMVVEKVIAKTVEPMVLDENAVVN
jgi:hypothetical protein